VQGSLEQVLADIRRKRQRQLDSILGTAGTGRGAGQPMSPMAAVPAKHSELLGMLSKMSQGGMQDMMGGMMGGGGGGAPGGGMPLMGGGGGGMSMNAPWTLGSGGGGGVGGAVGQVGNALGQGAQAVGSALGSAGSAIGSGIGAAASAVGGAASAAGSGIMSIIGLIGSLFSTARVKHDIHEFERIGDLRWVRFRYVPELDPGQAEFLGLLAEEVVVKHPEWVFHNDRGQPLGIHYDLVPREARPLRWR
jgi:hypothetical protein